MLPSNPHSHTQFVLRSGARHPIQPIHAMNSRHSHTSGTIERVLRQHLSQPGSAAQDAAAWDGPSVSRFLSGQQGVPIGKIDALVNAAGFVLISRKYLEAIGTLGEVGMYCHCARAGGGECGPSRQEAPTTSQELRGGRA